MSPFSRSYLDELLGVAATSKIFCRTVSQSMHLGHVNSPTELWLSGGWIFSCPPYPIINRGPWPLDEDPQCLLRALEFWPDMLGRPCGKQGAITEFVIYTFTSNSSLNISEIRWMSHVNLHPVIMSSKTRLDSHFLRTRHPTHQQCIS